MADHIRDRIDAFFEKRQWFDLPRIPALLRLIAMRDRLRRDNLYDTEEPALIVSSAPREPGPAPNPDRSIDGRGNDPGCPAMGAANRRFGRNVPLEHTFPDTLHLLSPNPRVVSRALMTRDEFKPATILNLLAAAWIQFMVHDWFVHRRSTIDAGVEIPLAPGDDWPDEHMRVPRTVPDPAPPDSTRPPAYSNPNSHWWDASQIYGSDATVAATLRTGAGGRLRVDANNVLPVDPTSGMHLSGFTDNWWVGLVMLHTIFTCEHNAICARLADAYPSWTDADLFARARLINAALMAKIHTVEWTPAILPHPVVEAAMRANWSGLGGEDLQDALPSLNDDEVMGGIVGSAHDHHHVAYSLTEEFVSVYRLHPLIPDDVVFRRCTDDAIMETIALPEMAGRRTADVAARFSMIDLFYSFGRAHPGAVTLHNYPKHLQNLRRDNGEHFDLAAVDIYRDRERGVPRYNQFRRLLHKAPVSSFEELTDNATWREEIRAVYDNDIEMVDLMTGLFAEPLPEGFGFSETAFRVFVLMASRRLKSDRFFTDDYRAEVYTALGLDYIRDNSMLTVLLRHYPALAPALDGVNNAFKPWTAVAPR